MSKDDRVENPKERAGRAKLPLHLVPPAASREMARALECGAAKYGAWNWREAGINLMTYVGAVRRHLDAIVEGEDVDPDSGISHIGHILAGAAIVADAAEHGMLKDDRPASMQVERAAARLFGVDLDRDDPTQVKRRGSGNVHISPEPRIHHGGLGPKFTYPPKRREEDDT